MPIEAKKLEHYKAMLKEAERSKTKMPLFIAIVLQNHKELESEEAVDVCRMFGMSDSYIHQLRSLQKVPACLTKLGLKITTR